MNIFGNNWQAFTQTKTGDGVIAVVGKMATMTSGGLTGVAQLERKINVQPGEVVVMRVLARLKSGVNGRIAISHPTAQAPKNTEYITSRGWRWYTVRFAVPLTHNLTAGNPDFVNLILGTYNEDNASVQMRNLQVSIESSSLPAPRVVAAAKIKMANGVPTLNPNFVSHGIVSLTFDSVANSALLVVQTDFTCKNNLGFIPLVLATHDGQLARQVSVGGYMDNSGLGRANIIFGNPSTGGIVDMTTIASLEFNLLVVC